MPKIVAIEIDPQPIEDYLRHIGPVSDPVLDTFLELLCGRFQGLLPYIRPTTHFHAAVGAGDDAVVADIRFSDECLDAALATAKFYVNRDAFVRHQDLPLTATVTSQETFKERTHSPSKPPAPQG